ncbi:MAG: eukaryotic-like serine/threonine-protein kinase [Frankiaceae bacterium]|nr:eukaryotic-like serine/threonine-protein kinase [Frankiaceae bacterium]
MVDAPEPRLLGGRYELGGPIGHGGMADVHAGHDTRLGRAIAVKILKADLSSDPLFHSRFRREAQSSAALNHPSIVAVYDTGEDETGPITQPYIVMEFVDGRTLREVLHEEGRLMPRRALEIGAEICSALEYSHEHGIVHRDIKPANVMLTRTGAIKVMDFGIARAASQASVSVTQTAAVLGTAQYLSPEQARGESVDARSDIYSLGCLMYELVTGQPPFIGDSPVAVAYQHVREQALPPSQRNADVPPALDAIIMKAMAKNPANRYLTAGDMRTDIERALSGRPVEATPLLGPPSDETVMMGAAVVPAQRPESHRGRPFVYLLFILLVIGVFFGAYKLISHALATKPVATATVPDVKSKPVAAAKAALTGAGFVNVTVTNQTDPVLAAGLVIAQDPVGNSTAALDRPMVLTVSTGAEQVAVPTMVGQSKDAASVALQTVGLKPKFVVVTSDQPKDQVLSVQPLEGTKVGRGSTVTLTLSKGQNTVPIVIGSNRVDATKTLQAAGFLVKLVGVIDDTSPEGTVIDQNPQPNSDAPPGSVVTITYAKPSPPTPSVTPTTATPTQSATDTPSSPPPTATVTASATP